MKSIYLASLLVTASLGGTAFAEDNNALSPPHITVNGTAVKEVVPDQLRWSLAVKNVGLDLPLVAEQHAKRIVVLLDALKGLGVEGKEVQTANMVLAENLVYRQNEWSKEGYKAETTVAFKLKDLKQYKDMWMALAGLSDVSISNVSFDHSDRIALNKETRKQALQAAKEKAAAMAAELSARVGEPLAVEEEVFSMKEYLRAMESNSLIEAGAGGDSSGQLAPGSLPITIRVKVTFRLISAG